MIVIVAPQSWLQLVENGEFSGSFWQFWPHYLDFGSDFDHDPDVEPSLVRRLPAGLHADAGPGCCTAGPVHDRHRSPHRRIPVRRPLGPLVALILPVTPFILYRFTLDPLFPTTHDLTNDWANHAHSLTIG